MGKLCLCPISVFSLPETVTGHALSISISVVQTCTPIWVLKIPARVSVIFYLLKKGHLSNYPITTSVNNLSLITGDQLIPGLSSVKRAARKRLITEIFELNFDFILLDLGSGTYSMVTDFFLLSNRGICVTAPEHGAILNTFAFLKNIVFRLFQLNFISEEARDVLEEARIRDETGKFPSFWDILNWLAENNKESAFYFKTMLEKIKPAIVFNMVEAPTDIKYLSDLTSLVYSKLIVETDILGYIVRHKMIAQSVKSRMPLSIQNPSLRAVQNIGKMSERLIANRLENKPLFDVGKYASSLDETAARLRSAPEFEQKNSEKKGMASAQTQSRKFKPGTRSTSANALQKSLINRSQPLPSHMSKSGSGLAQRLFGHPSVDRQMKKSLQQLMSGRLPLSL